MRTLAALALGGLTAGASGLVLAGVLLAGAGLPATSGATLAKGDRQARVVKVACDASTRVDAAATCDTLGQALVPEAAFATTSETFGTTTRLIRMPAERLHKIPLRPDLGSRTHPAAASPRRRRICPLLQAPRPAQASMRPCARCGAAPCQAPAGPDVAFQEISVNICKKYHFSFGNASARRQLSRQRSGPFTRI